MWNDGLRRPLYLFCLSGMVLTWMPGCGVFGDMFKNPFAKKEPLPRKPLPRKPLKKKRAAAPPAQLPPSPTPQPVADATCLVTAPLKKDSIALIGRPGSRINVYQSMEVDPVGPGRGTSTGPVIKTYPPGTLGTYIGPVYAHLVTFGAAVRFCDGTQGYLDVDDFGMIHRVARVRSDDTLNVRNGASHRHSKMTEIPPNGPVYVGASYATSAAGCEKGSPHGWWQIRTIDGVEGFVNCTFIDPY